MGLSTLLRHRWIKPLVPARFRDTRPIIPVVRLQGAIGAVSPIWQGLTVSGVAPVLQKAFDASDTPAVALVVNSPGGSAVQSHLIHRRIRALAEEKAKTVFVFVEDVAASGGYMIACAGDEIFADASSVIGSIGVISAGFGFERAIEKLGIERRLLAAGAHKGMLDPFLPLKPEEVAHIKSLQAEIHASFIALVEGRRDGKLVEDPDLFSGAFWAGAKAKALGLVDGLGDIRTVMRERFGEKVVLKPFAAERNLMGRRPPGVVDEATLAETALMALEERVLWARYGL